MSEQNKATPWMTPDEARAAMNSGTGAGVRIAVIDSGVDATHPRLRGLTIREQVSIKVDDGRLSVCEDEPGDVYGHGTAVAGLIHEVAPEAEIGSFRVIDARSLSRTAVICEGVRQAIQRGYHVLNCSFGCKGVSKFILPHKEWVDEAYLNGVHVVAACNNFDLFEPEWPAHFTSVIAVNMARTESRGVFRRPGAMVEFAARGENVEVPWAGGSTRIETGSSFAAPLVSGYVARLLSVQPGLPPAHVLDLLHRIAEPWHENLHCE